MKKVLFVIFLALLLVGCGTSESAVQTAIVETAAAKPIDTEIPKPTEESTIDAAGKWETAQAKMTLTAEAVPTETTQPTKTITNTPEPTNTPTKPPTPTSQPPNWVKSEHTISFRRNCINYFLGYHGIRNR